ncbi:MAG: type II CRISPR RNA-guided endonuclease Cas9 [Candidatus Thiodiazotropha sp.]
MKQPYLLALDIGTSSIGHVAFSIDQANLPTGILDLGVRIFSDGRDPKSKEPLAVARRTARGIRRNRDRGQNRVRRLVKELIQFGLLPEDPDERRKIFETICPYEGRYRAVHEKLNATILARAIFHIGRRRGFKSNRLAGDSEETEYKSKIEDLRTHLNGSTLGEYLYRRLQENHQYAKNKQPGAQKVIRFRHGETDFYADRQMYQDEFNRIRKKQGNDLLNDEQWDALEETVFWQYPLKPVPKGKCRFYPEETRAHIDLPISHEFRIYQEINALRYASQNEEYSLDERQRSMLQELLNHSKSVTFKGLLKKKDEHKSPYFPSDATFNLDVASRSGKLMGNRVMYDLRKPKHLGHLANELPASELNDIVHHLIEPTTTVNDREVVIETEALESWLQNCLPELSHEQVRNLCSYRFKRDTASVSRKFMQQIVPILRDTDLTYDKAVTQLENDQGIQFHHSYFETGEVFQKLPYYGQVMPESVWGAQPEADQNKSVDERDEDAYQYGKIANPTVHIALNQLRVVVNRLIDRMGGPPARIHVELTRDLKNSKAARAEIEKRQAKNKKTNERIRESLRNEFNIPHPRREDIQKIKLWEELGSQGSRCCVFTGRPISASQLFNGEVEIEHIIPFRRCYDDGMNNKTLAFKSANHAKLNRTPHEAFGHTDEYNVMMKRALASFGQGPKYDRFKENAFESFYGGEKGDMIERQLNDTKYISRKARQYLSCLCHSANVVPVNGQMTAALRDVWQLNHFKDKTAGHYRDDHRHHIVDAFVVGLTSRSLIKQLSTRRSHQTQTKDDLYHFLKSRIDDIPELKTELFAALDKVIASYKPDHTQTGSMFNDTAYGLQQDREGTPVCVTRKAVPSLSYEEIFRIRGKGIRSRLLDYLTDGEPIDFEINSIRHLTRQLKAHFKNEKAFEQKKQAFSAATGIRKLRINVLNNSVEPVHSAPFKGYGKNAYAYCDVWQIPHKRNEFTGEWSYKYEGVFIAYADVKKYQKQPARPVDKKGRSHPAAKKLMRLYKDDCIRLTSKDKDESSTYKIAGYSTSQNKLDIRPNLQAGNSGQNFISINTLFNAHQVHKLRA